MCASNSGQADFVDKQDYSAKLLYRISERGHLEVVSMAIESGAKEAWIEGQKYVVVLSSDFLVPVYSRGTFLHEH